MWVTLLVFLTYWLPGPVPGSWKKRKSQKKYFANSSILLNFMATGWVLNQLQGKFLLKQPLKGLRKQMFTRYLHFCYSNFELLHLLVVISSELDDQLRWQTKRMMKLFQKIVQPLPSKPTSVSLVKVHSFKITVLYVEGMSKRNGNTKYRTSILRSTSDVIASVINSCLHNEYWIGTMFKGSLSLLMERQKLCVALDHGLIVSQNHFWFPLTLHDCAVPIRISLIEHV